MYEQEASHEQRDMRFREQTGAGGRGKGWTGVEVIFMKTILERGKSDENRRVGR